MVCPVRVSARPTFALNCLVIVIAFLSLVFHSVHADMRRHAAADVGAERDCRSLLGANRFLYRRLANTTGRIVGFTVTASNLIMARQAPKRHSSATGQPRRRRASAHSRCGRHAHHEFSRVDWRHGSVAGSGAARRS